MDSSRHEPSLETPEAHPRRERVLRVLRRVPWKPIGLAAFLLLALLTLGLVCSPAYWR